LAIIEIALNSELESLVRSYARLSRDVGGRIVFACDLDSEDALAIAEQEKAHLDQAFFVLSFAALENQIVSLASARLTGSARRAGMRAADFETRWDTAARVAQQALGAETLWHRAKSAVLNWYAIRNNIAHGDSPTQLADASSVIFQADEISVSYEQVIQALKGQ
jgi:hypothetical protein